MADCKHPDSWFSRTIEPCGLMHYYCTACGVCVDRCSECNPTGQEQAPYTLETRDIRNSYVVFEAQFGGDAEEDEAAFDRWLAEHDRAVAEKAWDEGYEAAESDRFRWDRASADEPYVNDTWNPYTVEDA